jgi:hypothetical protein
MSVNGIKRRKYSLSAEVFCFASNNRHRSTPPPCPFGATIGSPRTLSTTPTSEDPLYRMGMTAAEEIIPRGAPHIAGPIHSSAQLLQHINGLSPTSQSSGGNAPPRGAEMPTWPSI